MKKEKGITLVALVVTIIILIILAGISINLTIGENGLITKAKQAKENMEIAEKTEKTELNDALNYIEEQISNDMPFEEKEDVKEFKKKLAEAITQKGVVTSENDSLNQMFNNLNKVKEYSIQEGQIKTPTIGPKGKTTMTISFANKNNKIPIIDIWTSTSYDAFALYHSVPTATTENATFTVVNGAGLESGSAILTWQAIYLGEEIEEQKYEVKNMTEVKKILAEIITKKNVLTDETMSEEEIINNIKQIKTYNIKEEGEMQASTQTSINYTINFKEEYTKIPLVYLYEKSKTGSWTLCHGRANTTLQNSSVIIWNPFAETGSIIVGWKIIEFEE